MDHDTSVHYLYFVHIGAVEVLDKENRILATYPAGSFFSDFQLILGLKAGYRYIGAPHKANYLF